ncbi:MAG TPA: tyrosine--tRNA ligase [Phycisphaerales bacterium]|nr:tyrosine--tRNA ligase [Phycisphaerales bacterium]
MTARPDFLDEIAWRGLLHQCTDEAGLRRHLATGSRRAYAGFDPTADSLTIGNLVPITALAHLQRAGHTPVVVMGGGTGLIGDPSGKSAERLLMTRDLVEANVSSQRRIFEALLDFSGPNAAVIVNNADWLCGLGYLDVLRDVGKHFSVNMMIQKESVRERLHNRDHGISYTEFSYMILQAYDFWHLHSQMGVTIQMGGSDQWGNIVCGADLIRRMAHDHSVETFGLTAPLVTRSDGGKFGKTEAGAIWLTADRTSPYAFYQFWLNAADDDAVRFLRLFTLLSREEIDALAAAHASNPGAREAQRTLARHVTARLHGQSEADLAERASQALFSGDIAGLPPATLEQALAGAPSSDHPRDRLAGGGVALLDLLVETGLAKSKREAREFLASGSVSVNGVPAGTDRTLTSADLLHGRFLALRRGKKTWHLTRWS